MVSVECLWVDDQKRVSLTAFGLGCPDTQGFLLRDEVVSQTPNLVLYLRGERIDPSTLSYATVPWCIAGRLHWGA